MTNPDRKALQVARSIHDEVQPELTILFGSRARGDYDQRSDIDLMLIQGQMPDDEPRQQAIRQGEKTARSIYGYPVAVQLLWRTPEEFRLARRYSNSVETRAAREGTIMPRDPENYSAHDYEDEETEFETDWTPYTENMRHAESHLELFLIASEIAPHNDIGIGQQAQNTLEFAMRALLEAHEAPYRRNHDIGNLLGSIRRWDPELRNFELSIPPNIYTDYEGERQYRRREQPRLTDFPGYRERTAADAERIMRRARAVQTARRAES